MQRYDRPPKDKRTTHDLAWQIAKELRDMQVKRNKDLIFKFKPSVMKWSTAITWLRKNNFIVINGALIAMTEIGAEWHDKRKEMLDD